MILGAFSRTNSWYLARLFAVRTLAVLAALVIILQTLDLLGESGEILSYPGNGDAQLWYYVSLRAPQIIARFLPFSVLLGALITLVTLNQNSEIIAMKAAGVSAHQILMPLIAASLCIAGLSFWFADHVVARATNTLTAWQNVQYGPVPETHGVVNNVWVRDGDDLIHANTARGRGPATRLQTVDYYDRSGGKLIALIHADRGALVGNRWVLSNIKRFDVAAGTVSTAPSLTLPNYITPDRFTLADVDGDSMSFKKLSRAIKDLKEAGRPVGPLETVLWHKISGPLSTILMPLLAAVAGFGLARSGRLFVRAVIGMGLGFAYFVADNFGVAMGNLGAYPPLLAAWAPFLLFLLIGEAVLIRTEE